ncbi:MAG: nickel insertion protein [Dethiobacter sp.]
MQRKLMKIIYFDCFAGASGDLLLAALLDAGALDVTLVPVQMKKGRPH